MRKTILGIAVLLSYLINSHSAFSVDCLDYSQEGTLDILPAFDMQIIPDEYWITGFTAHGDFVGALFSFDSSTYRGIKFFQLDSASVPQNLSSDTSYEAQYRLGVGDGSIASYRKWWFEESGTIYENHVLDLAIQPHPRGLLDHIGKTWILGQRAYVQENETLWIYSLEDVTDPQLLGSMNFSLSIGTMNNYQGLLLVTTGNAEFTLYDATDANNIQLVVQATMPSSPTSVALGSDFILMACGDDGLFKFGMSDPANPQIPNSGIEFDAPITSVVLNGDFAYAGVGTEVRALNALDNPPTLLPGLVSTPFGHLQQGTNVLYFSAAPWVYYIPLDCENMTPAETTNLGDLKSMFR